ncbi:unnamed protein product [marine sediment metagenome]|uniref:Uncharacterized protein n=1 Tax=marine sediment metagenome TaxID=412755 RepID=X0VVU3_9ZZZZ
MAAVLNRTTREYRPSAHTPDYPAEDWIHNPELPEGVPPRLWVIEGDAVRAMTAAETTASLAAAETARQAAKPAALQAIENEYLAICETLGLSGTPGRPELDAALYDLGKGLIGTAAYHGAVAMGLRLVYIAQYDGFDFADVPPGGHAE